MTLRFDNLREATFLIWGGGGGWTGALEGRVLSNFFYKLGRVKPGEGNSFFWQGKNYSMSLLLCIYKQSYQSRLI